MVLDLPPLLTEAGVNTHSGGLVLALRDASGRVFHGQPAVLEADPVLHRVELPEGSWVLAGIPGSGWRSAILPSLTLFRYAGLAFVALLVSLLYLTINQTAA
jgi:sensor domain CHASE-containing protein